MKKFFAFGLVVILGLGMAACNGDSSPKKGLNADTRTAGNQLAQYQTNQPVPLFNYSQLRQNLIEIETAQARTTQTTSFFFNQGVQDPQGQCPSIGFPIPDTYQLTNPQQRIEGYHGNVTVPQIEANGAYTADSTGTFVMCVDAQGRAYADRWEGYVRTVTGPAKWDQATHQVVLTGPPSFTFTKGK